MSSLCCNNCGKTGHSFHQCKYPITSFGIIAYRNRPGTLENEYLMVRRKDTLGYVDFMRGKYSVYNREYIANMLTQMTETEKHKIRCCDFHDLWNELWGITEEKPDEFKTEETHSRNKLEILKAGVQHKTERYNLNDLLDAVTTSWTDAEWGFPKGRRNHQERDFDCAIREFCEETGYPPERLAVINNVLPFEEIFTGSNMKSYKHKYYVAYMLPGTAATAIEGNMQTSEISGMEWKTYTDCMSAIRPYNVEKKRTLHAVHTMLTTNRVQEYVL